MAIFFPACIKLLLLIWVESLLLSFSGNVAINLDLRCNFDAAFSISPWNSNSIVVLNCVKSLFKTCISIYSLDITYAFLKLTMTSSVDDNLEIQSDNSIRCDIHPILNG